MLGKMVMVKIIAIIVLVLLSGLLYRFGGIGKPFNTKYRDFGVPTCMLALICIINGFHWSLILCWGAMMGSMTTYWGFINKWFKLPKEKKYWFNWLLTGFFYGFSMLPYAIFTQQWQQFLLSIGIVTTICVLVSELSANDWVEELGRGIAVALGILCFWRSKKPPQ